MNVSGRSCAWNCPTGSQLPRLVDTGFNGWLLMDAADAADLGFVLSELAVAVEFAGRGRGRLELAHGRILWLGRPLRVEVLVNTGGGGRVHSPDEPTALLGARLLSPHRLEIDFQSRRVVIREQES